MAINWTIDYRPSSFDDMALSPTLREKLEFYKDDGGFSHLIFTGETGVGKTTTARILCGDTDDNMVEYNCAQTSTREDMLKLARGTTSVSLWGGRRIMIMDEFHNVPAKAQTIFNKGMEDSAKNNVFIFCVNNLTQVADPIVSRCDILLFDVAVLHPKTGNLTIHSHTGFTKDTWIQELHRVGRNVAEKAGYSATQEQLDKVCELDHNIVDTRRFISALELRIKMDERKN